MIRHRFSWPKLSAISGVTMDQRLFLRLVRGVIDAEEVLVFLRILSRHIRGDIVLVWDNIPTHRSRKVREWLQAHPRFHVEPLPPYAPDLNADEGVWQYLKHNVVGNFCPENLDELEVRIRKGARKMSGNKDILRSFVKRTGLPI